MKIVVASSEKNMDGKIDERFELSKYLLLVDIDDNTLDPEIKSTYDCTISETELIDIINGNYCEAIITGILNEEYFNILADNGITRFDGRGLTINEAIEKMNNRTIGYFRTIEGEDGCSGNHHESDHDHGHEHLH